MPRSVSRPIILLILLCGTAVCSAAPAGAGTQPADAEPGAGTAVILTGTAPVCESVRAQLAQNADAFGDIREGGELGWKNVWDDASVLVPDWHAAAAIVEAEFDFDNDTLVDRVDAFSFCCSYMRGAALLVTLGSREGLREPASAPAAAPDFPDPGYWLLPCQWDRAGISLEKCPLFSQEFDEAGFDVPAHGRNRSVHFRARYSVPVPIRSDRQTYVVVTGEDDASQGYVAVLKPLPHKQVERTCLLQTTHGEAADRASR
jgi:hypothetical protein